MAEKISKPSTLTGALPPMAAAVLPKAPRKTKAALVRDLVSAPGGASLSQLMSATGWQAHTLRAALTGLRKSGLSIERRRDRDATIYRVSSPAEGRPGLSAQKVCCDVEEALL